jgi:PAS domain S-box-containing protein
MAGKLQKAEFVNGGEQQEAPCQARSERYEKLYTTLLDAIPSSVLMIDREMRVVSANHNFLEKSQHSLASVLGRRMEEIFPDVMLEHMNLTRQIRQVFKNNQPTRGQRMTYRAPRVPMRIYYYRILPFFWNEIVENVMLLMDDVTEQIRLSGEVRRVERHLASVVESASDIVLSTDVEGRILTWNPAAERISGYSFDEVKGRFSLQYFDEDCRGAVEKMFSGLKSGETSQMAEWDLMTKRGASILVSWVCSPMKDDRSQTVGIVAVGRDLTERRKLEMQLLQSQKLAALGVMASGIAHEIRNPLAICSSAAQFLMDNDLSAEFRRDCANKIHVGIQRASLIIENLLRFARPSASKNIEQLDLLALLEETLVLVANQARIQKIETTLHFPEESVQINGVASLLQQMFMNLFLNAIKAMPDGGVLSIVVVKKANEVLVCVQDSGLGISKADIDKIFDPFFTLFPVGQGAGLGLSICYSIVRQHFGTIEVDSVIGKGTTFTVRLPIL